MDMVKIIEELRNEAKKNPASSAVYHVFAMRQRARNVVVLNSLYYKMLKEGFKYPKEEYAPAIKLLATLGLGHLQVDGMGRTKGVKDIRVTLQSIGKAACGETGTLKKLNVRNKFVHLPVEAEKPVIATKAITPSLGLTLNLDFNGKIVHINVPKELTNDEITLLINKLH